MNVEALRSFLLVCAIINYSLLLLWFFLFLFARQWMRWLHGRWFRLSDEAFDAMHYCGIGIFKLGIILFNLVPYLALHFVD